MIFLHLTSEDGNPFYLNAEKIQYFEKSDRHEGSRIFFPESDSWTNVRETPEEILRLIPN